MPVYVRRLKAQLGYDGTLVVTTRGRTIAAAGPRATAEMTRALRAEAVGRISDPVARLARAADVAAPPPADLRGRRAQVGVGPDPDRRPRRRVGDGPRRGRAGPQDPAGDHRGPRPGTRLRRRAARPRHGARAPARPAARGAPPRGARPGRLRRGDLVAARDALGRGGGGLRTPPARGARRDRGRHRGRDRNAGPGRSVHRALRDRPRPRCPRHRARRGGTAGALRGVPRRRSRPASPPCRGCSSRTAPPCPSTPRATGRCCGRTRPHERARPGRLGLHPDLRRGRQPRADGGVPLGGLRPGGDRRPPAGDRRRLAGRDRRDRRPAGRGRPARARAAPGGQERHRARPTATASAPRSPPGPTW